ncbi:MAG: LEPR-XLL domain-containing protein, partial [Verrucomicrobiota bacterium]
MITQGVSQASQKSWFFRRCRTRAIFTKRDKRMKGRRSAQRHLFAEALEPRVLYSGSPIPEVTVDATQPVQSELVTPVDGPGVGTRQGPNTGGGNANAGAGEANEEMLEEHFTFTVEFENAGSGDGSTGYGPYIDVIVGEAVEIDAPNGDFGESDDIEVLVSATRAIGVTNAQKIGKVYNAEDLAIEDEALNGLAAGSSDWRSYGTDNVWVRPAVSFSGAAAAGPTVALLPGLNPSVVSHPLIDGVQGRIDANDPDYGFSPGDVFYVVRLPVSSMTEGQSPMNIRFTGRLDQDPGGDEDYGAKEGQSIDIRARGGFHLGTDPLDNPDSDAPIAHLGGDSNNSPVATNDGLFVSDSITPRVVEVIKRGPDDTALGPSDLMNYEIEVDIAAG